MSASSRLFVTDRIREEPRTVASGAADFGAADFGAQDGQAAKLAGIAHASAPRTVVGLWLRDNWLWLAIAGAAVAVMASIWGFTFVFIQTSEREAQMDAAAYVSELAHTLKRQVDGAAGASPADPSALIPLFEKSRPGASGLVALFGSDGVIRALASPHGSAFGGNVSGSEMFRRSGERRRGVWTGPSAPDGVLRMHAFRSIDGQDLTLVVGIGVAEEMRTVDAWAAKARYVAAAVSVMVGLMATLLAREASASQDREKQLAEDHAEIENAYSALAAAKASVDAKTSQLEATLAGMSDGVMMLDETYRLVQWNERFAELVGVPREVLRVGAPLEDLVRAQVRGDRFGQVDVETEVRRRMRYVREQLSEGISEHQLPGGPPLELRRSALPSGGYVTLYTDITARKQIEAAQRVSRRAAEEAAEQKLRFVATVSHEIRTPLNVVVSCLTLLEDSGMSPLQQRFSGTAREAGYALLDLVNDILELSQMEAGRPAIRPTVFALRPVLEGVHDIFSPQAAARGMTVAVEIDANVPDRIHADGGRIRQVLMNFVSNATKFSDPGRLTIRASVVGEGQSRPALRLSVQDQGPAVPEHEARQLFQPFSRLENARSSGVPGTGLGLAICERLTRLMDGAIGIGTAPTGGNDFWVTLPLEPVATAPAATNMQAATRLRRASVLIVEDIAANRLVTAALLRREGHRVDVADSGASAIALLAQRQYDLVFMDLIMPGMNGDETTRQIRRLPGSESVVPIVALTATTAAADRARCLDSGMNDMIAKPVRLAELNEVIARILRPTNPRRGGEPARHDAHASTVPAPLPLDLNRMVELQRGLPAGALPSLFEQCLADIGSRVHALRRALAAGQPRAVEECAHALKGVAATYGLAELECRIRRVISAARDDDIAAATLAAEGFESELARAGAAVRLELRDRATA